MCELKFDQYRADSNRADFIAHAKRHVPRKGRYKIGITCNPESRKSGYRRDYNEMVVVYQSHKWIEVQSLERELIKEFADSDNRNPGGEGRRGTPPFFIYIVRGGRGAPAHGRRAETSNSDGLDLSTLLCMRQIQQRKEARRREKESEQAISNFLNALADGSAQSAADATHPQPASRKGASSVATWPRQNAPTNQRSTEQDTEELIEGLMSIANGVSNSWSNNGSEERPIWTITPIEGQGLPRQRVRGSTMGTIVKYISRERNVQFKQMETQARGHSLYVIVHRASGREMYVVNREE